MALKRQPVIATEPTTRIPDEMPMENDASSISPLAASSKPKQPMMVSVLPTIMSSLNRNRAPTPTLDRKAFALNGYPELGFFANTDG